MPSLPQKPKPIKPNPRINASFGTSVFAGIFTEEFLAKLQGPKAMDVFDMMRRSDPQIKMIISAIKNPLLGAIYEIRPWTTDETDPFFDDAKRQAEFVKFVLFEDMVRSWDCILNEIYSFPFFGFAVFEEVNKFVKDHPEWGNYTGINSLNFISQKTVHRWNLDPDTGDLTSITQLAQGDLDRFVDLPSEFLHIFTNEQEGANFEGISLLRPCYKPWFIKNTLEKIEGIGFERNALGVPVATIPAGVSENDPEYKRMEEVLRSLSAHQLQSALVPEQWKLEILEGKFSASSIKDAIAAKDEAIARAVAANFLNLGQGGSGGAYALGRDLSDFFLQGIEYLGSIVSGVFNLRIIPRIIRLNFENPPGFPFMEISGISDKAGLETAQVLEILIRSGAVGKLSDGDMQSIRDKFGLAEMAISEGGDLSQIGGQADQPQALTPEQIQDSATAVTPSTGAFPSAGAGTGIPPGGGGGGGIGQEIGTTPGNGVVPGSKIPRKTVKFTETPRQLIKKGKQGIEEVMRANLNFIKDRLIQDVIKKFEDLPENSKPNAIAGIKASGVTKYKKALKDSLVNLAVKALNEVESENTNLETTKFHIKMQDPLAINRPFKKRDFMKLPSHVQKSILRNAELLAETQAADLEKAIFFQFESSVSTTDSAAILAQDMDESADKILVNSAVAADVASSKLVNETRHFFFFDPDVLDSIESFTFRNSAPVTDICTALNGRVFLKNDAESLRFEPPLHHNCKSFLEANEIGSGVFAKASENNKGQLRPSQTLQSQITLSGLSKGLFQLMSTPWVSRGTFKGWEIQSLRFDKSFSGKEAAEYAKKLKVKEKWHLEKDGTLIFVDDDPQSFESLHVYNLEDGAKAIIGARHKKKRRLQESTTVQTLIFDKEKFTRQESIDWALDHDFKASKVDETEDSYRLRQLDPGDFKEDSFRTIEITDGVMATVGRLK